MDYIENIKSAFVIWWNNKYLWVLGIIFAIFATSYNTNSNTSNNYVESYESLDLESIFAQYAVVIVLSLIFGLVWMLLAIYFGGIAKSGLIKSAQKIDQGEELSFAKSWRLGSQYWGKLFLQQLTIYLPFVVITAIAITLIVVLFVGSIGAISVSDFANNDGLALGAFSTSFMIFCGGLCLFMIIAMIVGIINSFANMALIVDDKDPISAISAGFKFLFSNFLEIFVSWLVYLPVSLAIGLVFMVIGFVIGIPMALIITQINIMMEDAFAIGALMVMVLTFTLGIFLALLQGSFVSLSKIYWTICYMRIRDYKSMAK